MKRPVPKLTLSISLISLLLAMMPDAAIWLVYDRPAILSGQIWRLFTGHLVHFSSSHLTYDLLAFTLLGCLWETQNPSVFRRMCITGSGMISGFTLLLAPHMIFCGGLSALATALMVLLALNGLTQIRWRLISLALLIVIMGKLLFEMATNRMMFVAVHTKVVPAVASHLAGVAVAVLFFMKEAKNNHGFLAMIRNATLVHRDSHLGNIP